MYGRNSFLAGILGLITFIFAINSFFIDAVSTANNLNLIYEWGKSSEISEAINDLLINIKLILNTYGVFIFLAIAIFIVYRRQ
ncbi:hypothetical protein [Anabaena sp. CCY 9910]|uniref:hypothetical protein n=1 Tax=Anabaena sp. CCY 9910 TaxID=3103870 RepID=UPI0039E104B0